MNPSTPTSATKSDQEAEAFDPSAPFIASDGLEYADAAACLLQQPTDNWRTNYLRRATAAGYDGARAINNLRSILISDESWRF